MWVEFGEAFDGGQYVLKVVYVSPLLCRGNIAAAQVHDQVAHRWRLAEYTRKNPSA